MAITLNCFILDDDETGKIFTDCFCYLSRSRVPYYFLFIIEINGIIDNYSERSLAEISAGLQNVNTDLIDSHFKKGNIRLKKYKLINGLFQSIDLAGKSKNEV